MYVTSEYTSHWTRAEYSADVVIADFTNTGDYIQVYRTNESGEIVQSFEIYADTLDAINNIR